MTIGEEKVYNLLKQNPNAIIKMISKETSISIRTVQRILASLKEKELIVRMGSDKTGYWKLIKWGLKNSMKIDLQKGEIIEDWFSVKTCN